MMNGYAMSGWGWLLMTLGMLGFWTLVAVIAVALLRRPGQPDQQRQQPPRGAEEILAQRLVRGELDPEEYRQRLQTLQETHQPDMTRATPGAHPRYCGSAQPLSLARSSGRSASCCWTMGPSIGS
jgi:putative membrane protein